MRALSLWQPWASLIFDGRKKIETRHWEMLYRGPLAIHQKAIRAFGTGSLRCLVVGGPCAGRFRLMNRGPQTWRRKKEIATSLSDLTERQQQVIRLMLNGKSSKEIAVALNISVKTAETHLSSIRRAAGNPGNVAAVLMHFFYYVERPGDRKLDPGEYMLNLIVGDFA